jgi:hypothetical protein
MYISSKSREKEEKVVKIHDPTELLPLKAQNFIKN